MPWEVVGADIFSTKNNILLHIVDYYRKFPVVKKTNDLLVVDLIRTAKIVFVEYGLPKKIVSNAGTNFISDKFKQFSRQLNIKQGITSQCYCQSNGQVGTSIKFLSTPSIVKTLV